MADSHDPQEWKKLLTQFREGYAKFSKASFYLEGMTHEKLGTLDRAARACQQEQLGFISWFVERAGCTEERRIYVWASIDFISGVFDEEARTLSFAALRCFCPLAERAGAYIPPSIRKIIPGRHYDAGSMWFSLLWWFNVEHFFESSKILDSENIVSSNPYMDSIKMIEECGLLGNSPAFPLSLSFTGDKVTVEPSDAQKIYTDVDLPVKNDKPIIETEIIALENSIPPFDKNSGKWVKNTRAAEIEGMNTPTLTTYRSKGIKNSDNSLGRDIHGRVWRRPGTPRSHPWYLRSTLKT